MSITIKPVNAEAVQKIFDELAPRHANNLARATNHGVAGVVRDEVRRNAPRASHVSKKRRALRLEKGVDKWGPLKKSIKAKRERAKPGLPRSTIRAVFYWRYFEDGTVNMPARPFINPVVERLRPQVPRLWAEQFGKKLEAALRRQAKKAARK